MKEVISINEGQIRFAEVQGTKQAEKLNAFISEVEQEMEVSFNNKDKVNLKNKTDTFLIDYLRPEFQFKKATDDFNIQALGVDLGRLNDLHRQQCHEWNKYPYNIGEDGLFVLDMETIREKNTKYATNEFQVNALNFAKDVIKLVERGVKEGILYDGPMTYVKINEAFPVLGLGAPEKDITNLQVNPGIPYLSKHGNNLAKKK